MSVQVERMWAEVLEAHTPNAAEMADAEAELQALGDVPPLPREDVDALVALATQEPGAVAGGGSVIGGISRARRMRQPLLRAAAAVILLMAAAWVAEKLVWAEARESDHTLDYAEAVELATKPGQSDSKYVSALSRIVRDCGYAAEKLRYLASQPADPLAKQAKEVSAELIAVLTQDHRVPCVRTEVSLVESADTAVDANLFIDVRRSALGHVRDVAKIGLTAMMLAKVVGDEAKQHRDDLIERLLHVLPR